MTAKRFFIFALLAGLFLGSNVVPALAHHSTAEYDMAKSSSVKGTVTQFQWSNPHAYIYIEVKSDKGDIQKWSGELPPLGLLSRFGWKRDTVKPGDQITLYGNLAKDGRFLIRLDKITLPDGRDLEAGKVTF